MLLSPASISRGFIIDFPSCKVAKIYNWSTCFTAKHKILESTIKFKKRGSTSISHRLATSSSSTIHKVANINQLVD